MSNQDVSERRNARPNFSGLVVGGVTGVLVGGRVVRWRMHLGVLEYPGTVLSHLCKRLLEISKARICMYSCIPGVAARQVS
jgi:hypothetical protein